jgi:hypothetical protein
MRTILVGDCAADRLYQLSDPDALTEPEFEYAVARALTCIYQNFRCIVFGGSFHYLDRTHKPDLALVAKDFSHWFIIEVELISHSLDLHVLPQIRTFSYGVPAADCISILSKQLGWTLGGGPVDDKK